jgi:hypothetical protein
MVQPSALNVIIVGLMMIIFTFLWRMLAARLAENNNAIGDAMAVAL